MRKRLLWAVCLLICRLGYSYPCADINFTPFSGAENLLFVHQGLEKVDQYINPTPKITKADLEDPENCDYFSTQNQWIRKAKTILIWMPINLSCMVTQHEVFGHGYRIRDLGTDYARVNGYQMYVFGGATDLDITNRLSASQMITIDIAGLEADMILANRVRLKWLGENRINYTQNLLYPLSSLSSLFYSFTVHKNPVTAREDGNDIKNFLFFLNSTYQDVFLGYKAVKSLLLINLLDPILYYSILSAWIYHAFSIAEVKIPMIPIGNVKYLPSFRMALTPFGMQGYFENFFVVNSIPTYVYFKWGQNGPNQYWGLGVENQKIFNWKRVSLGCRFDLWNQPNVLFETGAMSVQEITDLPKGAAIPPLYPTSVLNAKSLGAAFSIMTNVALFKAPIQLYTELGYKTAGYLPGEALRNSPIARGGISGQF